MRRLPALERCSTSRQQHVQHSWIRAAWSKRLRARNFFILFKFDSILWWWWWIECKFCSRLTRLRAFAIWKYEFRIYAVRLLYWRMQKYYRRIPHRLRNFDSSSIFVFQCCLATDIRSRLSYYLSNKPWQPKATNAEHHFTRGRGVQVAIARTEWVNHLEFVFIVMGPINQKIPRTKTKNSDRWRQSSEEKPMAINFVVILSVAWWR